MTEAREAILSTALQLFLRSSYKEVTMSELVKASGLSKGAFYHYFASKEALFQEIIRHFYTSLIREDYSRFSHESLAAFCRDYLAGAAQRLSSYAAQTGTQVLRANHYVLLFDALKRLPEFRALRDQQQAQELAAWTAVVRQARESGEIAPASTDEQVAKLFVYLGDGIAISYVLHQQADESLHEFTAGFDALYRQLKA